MADTPIFCHGEGRAYPANQFRRDQNGNLCVPYIHEVTQPHDELGVPVNFSGCADSSGGGGSGGGGGSSGGGVMPGLLGIPDILAAPEDRF